MSRRLNQYVRLVCSTVVGLSLVCCLPNLAQRNLLAADVEKDDAASKKRGLELFEKSIRPVLIAHCYECHSSESKTLRGGLLLDTRAGSRTGGDSGAAVVPGDVGESLLVSALRYDDFEMPPKRRLSDRVIADFEKWIKLGAPDPRDGKAALAEKSEIDFDKARKFWAFQPPREPATPNVKNGQWPRSEIDKFVLTKLEQNNLTPAADADRRTLLRRITFDLTGLPPTPEEIRQFLDDQSDKALERVVDRLMASRHFGEQWGRHWLDIARYADSNGGDINLTFHNAWRYRDYVIDAFNNDKPFDRFIVEQLAGDLMPFENDAQRAEQLVASGFLIVGPKMLSERDKEKLYMDVVDEQLSTIGRSFLGLTLGCARCHDHKFDPIPTRDYYALAGILRSTTTVQGIRMNNVNVSGWIEQPLPISPEHAKQLAAHGKRLEQLNKQLAAAKSALDGLKKQTIFSADSLPGIVVDDVAATQVGAWKKSTFVARYVGAGYVHDNKQDKGKKSIRFTPDLPRAGNYEVRISYTGGNGRESNVPITVTHADGEASLHVNQVQAPKIDGLFHSLGQFRFEAGIAGSVTFSTEGTTDYVIADAVQFIPVELLKDKGSKKAKGPAKSKDLAEKTKAVKQLQQQVAELKKKVPPAAPMAMAPADRDELADCPIRIRGEPHNHGETIPRGYLTVLSSPSQPDVGGGQSGRLQMAHWIASRDNPLTARVMVNRIWHHLFGVGLVRSVDNFGHQGDLPSHPELLDYLASRFLKDGWSIKKTIRRIVLSRVYRLGTGHSDKGMALDPQNRLLWRHNRRRLTAESLRDAILSASGALDRAPAGSSVAHLGEQAIANNLKDKTGQMSIDRLVRRSVYLPLVRNDLPEMLTVFDFADPDVVVGARSVTTVPSQALMMMNSAFVADHARRLSERVLEKEELTNDERLHVIYEITLGRLPNDAERKRVLGYIESFENPEENDSQDQPPTDRQAWSSFCHALLASTEFRFVD